LSRDEQARDLFDLASLTLLYVRYVENNMHNVPKDSSKQANAAGAVTD
jgi:hypothetical protein